MHVYAGSCIGIAVYAQALVDGAERRCSRYDFTHLVDEKTARTILGRKNAEPLAPVHHSKGGPMPKEFSLRDADELEKQADMQRRFRRRA